MKKQFLLAQFLLLASLGKSQFIKVPDSYASIQEAINQVKDGDSIMVAPGIYYENINFKGKEIFLTSHFHLTNDKTSVLSTIINGSKPSHPDTASCVLFLNNETNKTVLKGFTITGGKGTRTYNSNEDLYFRTGGGILINHSSPTITHNIITHNQSISKNDSVTGAAGGGLRIGNGAAILTHNIISYNTGGYAGGIMLAFCQGTKINNNVITHNTALGDFGGGGGIYIDWRPIDLINNTIANNHSGYAGGAMVVTGTNARIRNCIIYGNTADTTSPQIYLRYGGDAEIKYTNISGGWDGVCDEVGNLDTDPFFQDTLNYYLSPQSPCIDMGDPRANFNDTEDPSNPGKALFPSLGTIRNDMGAYGWGNTSIIAGITKPLWT